ncbi:GNAT family N-acetyltransferase [Pelagimonas varians]|uniref:Aminoglycoside N(6')-acetyltransferase type 1 n=1 Tax=Pelagimonas varians TaxID=696760 RepID=A0A238L043_9RHOB|nr:GNAT family N-acetyltransferase [Pelagimonas varians]PYG27416.1 N-acetylglutamate synthase-like GNAT family acetyltransferase [Pelagimonas varians]SMX48443.1 Aminoglycoside N(6')-acetyltransferase type 1 [Pelagimonas varians]
MKNSVTPDAIIMRSAARSDVERILSMVRALAHHHGDIPDVSAKTLERDIFGEIPWIYALIAEVDGRVVGYAALCPMIKLEMGERGIDMHHLFVEAEFRGSGIGRRLINASMAKARELNCESMTVGTHPDNANAQAVYLACGFEQRHSLTPRFRIYL